MLDFRLDRKLPEMVSPHSAYDFMIYEVIRRVEAEGDTLALISAARDSRPKNAKLVAFAEQFGLASVTPELERIVTDGLSMINPARWRSRLGEIEGRVCRIDIP